MTKPKPKKASAPPRKHSRKKGVLTVHYEDASGREIFSMRYEGSMPEATGSAFDILKERLEAPKSEEPSK